MYFREETMDFDPRGDSILTLEVDLGVHSHIGENSTRHAAGNLAIIDDTPLATGELVSHQIEGQDPGEISAISLEEVPNEVEDYVAGGPAIQNVPFNIGSSHSNTQGTERGPELHEDRPCAPAMDMKGKISTRIYKLRVSSKHLELRSNFFAEMFQNTTHSDKEIPLEGDDIDALVILLNIAHGFMSRVPLDVSRDMLFEILKLIDKYEFHETATFTNIWFTALEAKVPAGPDQHLTKWLYICYRLGHAEHFASLTKIAVLEVSSAVLLAPEARITHIITKIQACREAVLGEIISTLSKMIKSYEGPEKVCGRNPNCDALALGLLLRGLSTGGLQPLPDPVLFSGSVHELLLTLRGVKLAYRCDRSNLTVSKKPKGWDVEDYSYELSDRHIEDKMISELSKIEAKVQGLAMSDFPLS